MVSQRRYASSRHSSIQAGSFFFAEMNLMVSSERPLGALSDSISVSNPYRYGRRHPPDAIDRLLYGSHFIYPPLAVSRTAVDQFRKTITMFLGRNHLLRTVQAVFRRYP